MPKNPQSMWEATLDQSDAQDRRLAGEIEPGDEPGGGGDKGLDAATGDGGYGGDAALEGVDQAELEPERPLDAEIHGDPRTHDGEPYPDDAKVTHEGQRPPAGEVHDDDEDVAAL